MGVWLGDQGDVQMNWSLSEQENGCEDDGLKGR